MLLRYNDIKKIAPPTSNGTNAVITGSILTGEGGQSVSMTGWYENTGYFYLYNTNRHWYMYNVATSGHPDNNTYAYRSSSNWGTSDRSEMSAARAFDVVQRYYLEVQGRNSFNDSGAYARANVHEGVDYVNAYWDGTDFHFGDGDGVDANSLAVLDVCGHEFTHAVTEYTADLIYSDESGALNESFSDVFGACVEFYVQPDGRALYPSRSPGTADWLCGEDCWLSSVALRDLRNPRNTATVGAGNEQPSRYQGTYWYSGSGDNGGVHQNSGVQNFFFYILSEGGSGDNDGITYSVTGIGVTNAERVAYRALTVYCTPNTDYQAVPSAWMSAAMDLNTNWAASVSAAWSAAGIGAFYVNPDSAVTFRGPVGGPFSPPTQTYSLFNRGALPMNWSVAHTQAWLNVTPTSGTISGSGPNLVSVSINAAAANGLPMGIYTDILSFSNSVDAAIHTRQVKLLVGQPDYFTELFDANDNDLDFRTWTFTPDGSTSFYSVCREVATNFPTDPTGGTTVSLTDDSYRQVTLTGTNTVAIYNRRANVFFIGSNGYLTMDSGDSTVGESFANHFNRPRISACFDDLDPSSGGTVSWKQTSELVAVTFANVREYGASATVSFQIEMFYDGRIRITYLAVGITDGLAGLSAGGGVPAGFAESDLTSYGACRPPDDLVVTPYAGLASEGYEGGPFAPPSTDYTLSNAGTNSLNWSATATQPWLTVSPTSGTLPVAAGTNVAVFINSQANSLPPGLYPGTLTVSNLGTGFRQTRSVSLRVKPIPGEILVLDSIPPATDLQVPFGNVIVGLSGTNQITITNTDSSYSLIISNISLRGGLYVEDFDDGLAQDWVPEVPAHWQVVAGEYRAQAGATDLRMQSLYFGQAWQDCAAQVVMRRSGDLSSAARLLLRATDDFSGSASRGSAYAIAISGDGSYYVGKYVSGTFTFIQEWTDSPYLNIGTATNTVLVNIQGSAIRAYFNGNLAWSGSDTSITAAGRLGLLDYSGPGPETIHYHDSVVVSSPLPLRGTVSLQQQYYNEYPLAGGSAESSPSVAAPAYPGKPDPWLPPSTSLVEFSATSGPWRLEKLPAFPYSLPPHGALTLDVTYEPTTPGSNDTMVVIECNDADEPRTEVQLTGQGIPDHLRVTPGTGFISQGAPGGPFSPSSTSYVLSNAGPGAVSWATTHTQAWVNVSPSSGTLAVGQSASVIVALAAPANSLPGGQYADTLVFSNLTSGAVQRRTATLSVRPDYFTELFGANDNDLDFQTWTFTPDGTGAFYSVCREVATNFLTDPTGGVTVSLTDDSYRQVTLASTNTVAIYNRRTNVFFIGSNGYLTMDSGDSTLSESAVGKSVQQN